MDMDLGGMPRPIDGSANVSEQAFNEIPTFKAPLTISLEPLAVNNNPTETSGDDKVTEPAVPRSSTKEPTPVPISLKYEEPPWAKIPTKDYFLEILKNGVVVNKIDLSGKSFFTIGRLPGQCDICCEHPSCSRFHAVLQFGRSPPDTTDGFYLYDLKSAHGTLLNKAPVPAETYMRVHVGFLIKFAASTRLYVMQGPSEDEEEELNMTVTELKAATKQLQTLKVVDEPEDSGIDWGFGPDATEEAEEKAIGFLGVAPVEQDAYYTEDPKKALNAFFLREGMDMEYDVEEIGHGHKKQFHCRIPLPIETPNGIQISAEATVSGKKKDALAAAILEACRLLHTKGVLKGTTSIGRQKKGKNWADEDFYDSDEDTFLDRTGTVERKRQRRIQRLGKNEKATETYESLTLRLEGLKKEVNEINEKLQKADQNKAESMGDGGIDALDSFMDAIKSGLIMDTKTKIKLKQRLTEMRQEEAQLIKLITLVKPVDLPPVEMSLSKSAADSTAAMIGRLKQPALPAGASPVFNHDNKRKFVPEEDDEEGEKAVERPEATVTKMVCVVPSEAVITDKQPKEEEKIKPHEVVTGDVIQSVPAENIPYIQTVVKKRRKDNQSGKIEYNASDPDYAMWIPPEDQAGDGRTSLNERLGY